MITSIVFNGLTIGEYQTGYLLGNTSGFDYPITDIDIRDRGNYIGAELGSYLYGRRVMTLEGEIVGADADDYEDKRRALEQALDVMIGLQTFTITTRGGIIVQTDAIINKKPELPYQKGQIIRGAFQIELSSPYPFFLGTTEQSTEVSHFIGGGGALPARLPFSLGSGGSGATTIVNAGNGQAYPVIRLYGVITNPSITNVTTGKSLSFTYSLASSTDYIEIDTFYRTVKLNGITNIRQYLSGDWWSLIQGNNSIKFRGSDYSASAVAVITYRDTYIGI